MRRFINPRIFLICALSLSLISWDQVSKDYAREHLRNKAPRAFVHDSFRLEYVENTGAAMSFADDLPPRLSFWLLGIVPLAVLMGLFGYMMMRARTLSKPKLIALSLIFAGGMGNILDRLLFDRHVSDFMNVGVSSVRSGIFNFADMWIFFGAIWVVMASFRDQRRCRC